MPTFSFLTPRKVLASLQTHQIHVSREPTRKCGDRAQWSNPGGKRFHCGAASEFFFSNWQWTCLDTFDICENTTKTKQQNQRCGTSSPTPTPGHSFGFGCLFQEGKRPTPRGPALAGVRDRKKSWEIGTLLEETEAHAAWHCYPGADFPWPWLETERKTPSGARSLSDGSLLQPILPSADNFTSVYTAPSKIPSICGSSINTCFIN